MGPALEDDTRAVSTYTIMSLRDYFAGQALAGICSDNEATDVEWIARWCWKVADEMIKAREES